MTVSLSIHVKKGLLFHKRFAILLSEVDTIQKLSVNVLMTVSLASLDVKK